MAKKVVIYGYTALGSKIANILNDKKYEILVVDSEQSSLIQASKDGFDIFESTLLNDNDLIEIGIDKNIDALFCEIANQMGNGCDQPLL